MAVIPIRRGTRTALPITLLALGVFCLLMSAISVAPAHAQTSTVLSGYVFNYKGEFVSGATITLYTLPAHTAAGPVTTSDANGGWSMDTGTGTFAVTATAPGYDFSEQTVYATSYQTGITFILRATGQKEPEPLVATISGKVTSLDNVPLGGMVIVATNAQDTGVHEVAPPPTLNITTTSADGTYSMQVPAGTIWLTLKTGSAWGYQRPPITVNAKDTVTGADFAAAVRVIPRSAFPSVTVPPAAATAVPSGSVGGNVGGNTGGVIGMPTTGQADSGAGLWLAGLGLLAVLAGSVLAVAGRVRRA